MWQLQGCEAVIDFWDISVGKLTQIGRWVFEHCMSETLMNTFINHGT